jgi:O-antigen/teichoic acid export membrane protein
MRYLLSSFVLGLCGLMALIGPPLVELMYDPRYQASGGILVVMALVFLPQIIGMSYDQAALAAGDSRRFFIFSACRAGVQVLFLLVGVTWWGLLGGMIGMGIAGCLVHLVLIWLARIHQVWDPRHDVFFSVISLAIMTLALWMYWDGVIVLAGIG